MKPIVLALALILVAPQSQAQGTSTTTCVPQPRSAQRGKIICTTTPGGEADGGRSILSGIIKMRLGYLEGQAQAPRGPSAPTQAQVLEFLAIARPLSIATADSLALVGTRRQEYQNEAAALMVELFRVYPDAGSAVISMVLAPLATKYGALAGR